jgi:hypothetical protein
MLVTDSIKRDEVNFKFLNCPDRRTGLRFPVDVPER